MSAKTLGHVHLRDTDFHTTVTLEEVVEAAKRFGFNQIDLTPHLRDPSNPHRPPPIPFNNLGKRWEEVEAGQAAGTGPKIRLGLEANIVPIYHREQMLGVSLDFEPDTPLASPVIASFHFTSREKLGWPKEHDSDTCPQQDPLWVLRGYLEILEDYKWPLDLTIIGHPFEYASRPPTAEQIEKLAKAARQAKVVLEISLRRLLKVAEPSEETLQQKVLLLRPPHVDVFAQTGVNLYLGTDIHNSNELSHLDNIQLVAEYLINRGVQKEQIVGWED